MIKTPTTPPLALGLLIAVQAICAAFFLGDAIEDGIALGWYALSTLYFWIESIAAATLLITIAVELRLLMGLLRRKAHLERQVSLAAGAFHDIMHDYFATWGLTAAEQDVATFTIKGLSISEIAGVRGSAEGTVKSHLNNIYRKADVPGRGALLGLLIEDLMAQPLLTPPAKQG